MGSAGVEQAANSVMSKVHESKSDSLDPLRQVVHGFGRPVRYIRPVPRDDLVRPSRDRSAEPADLERHLPIGEVTPDLGHPLDSEHGVGVVIDLANDLLRVPREPDLLARIASAEQAEQLVVLDVGEALAGDRQPAPGTPQRIVTAAAMSEGLVLHPTPTLIESGVGKLHDVEWIRDLDGVREHRVEHRPIGGRQIERRPLDPSSPLVTAFGQPSARPCSVPAWDDIEELPSADIDDLSRPQPGSVSADPGEQGLVEPERGHGTDPVGVIDQLFTDGDDGVHHRMPAATEIGRDLGHRTAMTADLQRHPPSRPCRQQAAGGADLGVFVAPAQATRLAAPALLAPHQPGRPAERRQIHQHHISHPVTMHDPATRTARPLRINGDDDTKPQGPVADTGHDHVGQADQQRTHARSIRFQAGAPRDSTTSDIAENRRAPVPRPGPSRQITPPSNAKRQ